MKKTQLVVFAIIFLAISASGAAADVNAALHFTNDTDEALHVELFVFDHCCTHIYDLHVRPGRTSAADFWARTSSATYSACAYGEMTGDFYGCIEGGVSDYHSNVYFDDFGEPYLSTPSDPPAEVFVFQNPYHRDHVHGFESDSRYYARVACFIGSMSF
jgi:hypothetical protein